MIKYNYILYNIIKCYIYIYHCIGNTAALNICVHSPLIIIDTYTLYIYTYTDAYKHKYIYNWLISLVLFVCLSFHD